MNFGDCEMIELLTEEIRTPTSSPSSSSVMKLCRICHEEEADNSSSMEAPCSCSGTLKFAHRGCIQRWCSEKGSNVCEICLQKFEPEYPVTLPSPAKLPLIDTFVIIRRSLVKHNYELDTSALPVIAGRGSETGHMEAPPPSVHRISWCRLAIIIITVILLVRNFVAVVSGDADGYAFSVATVLALRAVGILVPFCLLMRLVTVIHDEQKLLLLNNAITQMHEEDDLEQQ